MRIQAAAVGLTAVIGHIRVSELCRCAGIRPHTAAGFIGDIIVHRRFLDGEVASVEIDACADLADVVRECAVVERSGTAVRVNVHSAAHVSRLVGGDGTIRQRHILVVGYAAAVHSAAVLGDIGLGEDRLSV